LLAEIDSGFHRPPSAIRGNQQVQGSLKSEESDAWEQPHGEGPLEDPLLDCLVFLTKHFQRPFSAESLRAGLPLVEHRLTPKLFVRAAERAHFSARIVQRKLDGISELLLPAVLLLENRQACVLLGFDRRRRHARIAQPEAGMGEQELEIKALAEQYTGNALFVRAEHRFDTRSDEIRPPQARHWFWGTLLGSWRIYRDVLVASLLINLFALASPLFIMNVYDRVVPNQALDTLWVLAIGVAIVFFFDFLMRGLRGYFIDIAGKKSDVILSGVLFEKVLGLKMEGRPKSVGAFANHLREFDSIRDFITSATVTAIVDLPFVFLFVLVIWLVGGPLAYIPLLAIPMVAFYALAVQPALRRAVEQVFRTSTEKNATLVESLVAAETVKTLGAEGLLQRKWEQACGQMARWGVRSRLLSSSAVNVGIFLQHMATVGTVVLGVYLIGEGQLSMGGLIACVILVGRAMGPLAQVASLSTRDYQARTALQSLDRIMQLPVDRPEGKSFLHRASLGGEIEFQNVDFTYPEQQEQALRNVSFRIREGEHVAIIGRIGSGKTTIQKLVLGLYEPNEGAVRVGRTDVRQLDPADLRRQIGYVPQDVTLFYGTLRDNIRFGVPFADDASVLRAAQIAGVTEFTDRHPQGFDLQVGERGEGLSGGQKQVVAVARALLNDPPILLMDEPSNSMDNTSEQQLKQRLVQFAAEKTLILITHRASLLDLVERIIVLDSGILVADGPKAQVLQALKQGRLKIQR
jgi:ATP-binding cassette subfamily C protein LapB